MCSLPSASHRVWLGRDALPCCAPPWARLAAVRQGADCTPVQLCLRLVPSTVFAYAALGGRSPLSLASLLAGLGVLEALALVGWLEARRVRNVRQVRILLVVLAVCGKGGQSRWRHRRCRHACAGGLLLRRCVGARRAFVHGVVLLSLALLGTLGHLLRRDRGLATSPLRRHGGHKNWRSGLPRVLLLSAAEFAVTCDSRAEITSAGAWAARAAATAAAAACTRWRKRPGVC